MPIFDSLGAAGLISLAVFILISGLDDLVLDFALMVRWLSGRFRSHPPGRAARPAEIPERRMALFVPMWREDRVARGMLEHNLAAIRYGNYDIFVGAYPNDGRTLEVIRSVASRFPRVHLAVCPHDGPTSKADCLNWIYQHMLLDERNRGASYEIVVVHDAEDLVHPDSLRWINHYSDHYDMVQIPVLPLPTPGRQFTHGVYCDEFGEYQTRDVPLRRPLGGFLPSNGVGTGYSRRSLEALAQHASNRVFEPECLTEDYENGLRLHRLGFRQIFVPLRFQDGNPVATREYFPLTFRQAIRQRTRWVTGIVLQSWERHGWGWSLPSAYWFWRDRKGLLGNPASLLSNFIFAYGLGTWLWSRATGGRWPLEQWITVPVASWLLAPTLFFGLVRLAVRTACVGRIYGPGFALGVPLRAFWANWMNSMATMLAVHRYAMARWRGEPVRWVKTEHLYPSIEALAPHKRRLGEILVESSYLRQPELDSALARQPAGVRLGEHLMELGLLTEEEVYEALSLQQNLPVEMIDPRRLQRDAGRFLPARLVRKWKVMPFRVTEGSLHLATPEVPADEVLRGLRRHTRLHLRFTFVTPTAFQRLVKELL